MYRELDYEKIVKELTDGTSPWSRMTKQEVMSFPMTRLTKIPNVWFYFISCKIVPSKHLSIVRRDKAILTYAIVKDYKFNVGKIIENFILELVYNKAIAHPSMITKLCEIVGWKLGRMKKSAL